MQYSIEVISKEKQIRMEALKGERLLDVLRKQKVLFPVNCGGLGECGKCKVLIHKKEAGQENKVDMREEVDAVKKAYTEKELALLTEDEILQGIHLACEYRIHQDIQVAIDLTEEEFSVLSHFNRKSDVEKHHGNKNEVAGQEYRILIDIGTTTIAVLLENRENIIYGAELQVNKQRIYGADVLSRMKSACEERIDMTEIIRSQLDECVQKAIDCAGALPEECSEIVVAGNTTMLHFLLHYPVEQLSVYPFTPYNKELRILPYHELFHKTTVNCMVHVFPSISAFVGGDIVAGMLAVRNRMKRGENKKSILLDLGTNGEIVIMNENSAFATATAMGPAFEGGAIGCGVGSIPGAICKVYLNQDGDIEYETIDKKSPIGICGSGMIDLCAILLEQNKMDDTGLLAEPYFSEGIMLAENIKVTQADIRSIQLAKGAVCAGLLILLKQSNTSVCEIDALYLAGGFGYALNKDNAVKIGLIPPFLKDHIKPIGNACLAGMEEYAEEKRQALLNEVCETTKEINLALVEEFHDVFIEQINFCIKNAPEGI